MITLRNVTLRRGQHILLNDVNWTIYHKQHIGIIGANGSGKSSLFSMLLNQLQPDKGDIEIPRQLKLAHMAQEMPGYAKSALDFVLDGDSELRELEKQLVEAEKNNDGNRIAILHSHLHEIDGYAARARAAQLLDGLGFNYHEQHQKVSEFSGGWRVRLNLAKALMSRSDVLLLDEPTNHLDLDAIIWLESWLVKYPGTLLLISHDREFLDDIVDHIAHITDTQLKLYTGNYSSFEKQRAEQLMIQQAAYEKQQKQIAHLQSFINRFKAKASKARQAQSRIKALDRMELITAMQADSPFEFHFKEVGRCPNPLITLTNAVIKYDDKTILKNLSFSITPKDRIALLGPNGAGKSSLIKLLAGELAPSEGERETGDGLKIGYFAQHQVDHLDQNETPIAHFQKIAPNAAERDLRTFLGGFGFSGTRVFEIIKNFSGGEKSRLALALIVYKQPNLLLLDEPTNHLDLEMRQALSIALQEYQGAVILVSHDRFLIRTTVDQLSLVAEGETNEFSGDLNDYEQWLFAFRRKKESNTPLEKNENIKKKQRKLDAEQRELRKPLLQKIKQLETQLEKLQKEVSALEIILEKDSLYKEENKQELQKHLLKQADVKKELESVEQNWLLACEELEKL